MSKRKVAEKINRDRFNTAEAIEWFMRNYGEALGSHLGGFNTAEAIEWFKS